MAREAEKLGVPFPKVDPPKAKPANPGELLRGLPSIWSYEPEPPDWGCENLHATGCVTLISAKAGDFKTMLALALSRASAHGESFLGRECRWQPVIYLDRENPVTLVRKRLDLLAFAESPAFVWWGMAFNPSPPLLVPEDFYVELVRSLEKPPLLIFDSLVRFHRAESENAASDMAEVMAALRRIASAGSSVIVLHHRGKAEASEYRGSSDIQAGVDLSLMQTVEAPGILKLTSTKNRLGEPFSIAMRFDITTEGGFVVIDDPAPQKARREYGEVAEYVRQHPGASKGEIEKAFAAKFGRSRLREILTSGARRKDWQIRQGAGRRTEFYPPPQGDMTEIEL